MLGIIALSIVVLVSIVVMVVVIVIMRRRSAGGGAGAGASRRRGGDGLAKAGSLGSVQSDSSNNSSTRSADHGHVICDCT